MKRKWQSPQPDVDTDGPMKAKIAAWIKDPLLFVQEALKVPPHPGITTQQREGLEALRVLVLPRLKRLFAREANLPCTLSADETAMANKFGLSIMSGQGCHAKGTMVMRYDGSTVPVEDVAIGDHLMGDDGLPRAVLALARGREEMFRIRYRSGESYVVNGSHKLCLMAMNNKGLRHVGDVVEVPVWDYLEWGSDKKRCHAGYRVGVEEFGRPQEPLRIPPYILGLWLGDGSKDNTTLFSIDQTIIDQWRAYGESLGLHYNCRIEKEHSIRTYRGQKNAFWTEIHSYDLADNKHIPDAYLFAGRKDRLELLAGLLDTDGHLDKRDKRQFSIIQKSQRLATQIQCLARSLGMRATLTDKIKAWTWNGKRHEAHYHEVHITRNIEHIPTRLPRKQAASSPRTRCRSLTFGFTVEPLGEGDYYGFTLNGNHRYLLDDFTVTRNTGKDTFCAWAVLWFLLCMKNAKILCTAPTAHQLKTVLWSEIAKWLKGSLIEPFLTHQSNVLYVTEEGGKTWFASWRTISTGSSPDEQATVLAGQHEDRMMFVVDEAAAVPDPVYKPIEGAMTSLCNIAIVIFNPTLTTGYALKTQYEDAANWVTLRWNAEDSELLQGTGHCERMEKKYGRESAAYRIRVLGQPPYADTGTLIPHDWVQRAVDREVIIEEDDVPLAGLDVSGGGKDGNVFCYGQGYRIFPLERRPTLRSKEIVEWAHQLMYQYEIEAIAVDSNAVGVAVAEGLQDLGHYVLFCNVGRVPVFSDKESVQSFQRLRDEIWWMIREAFEYDRISIPNDQSLIDQLPVVRYRPYEGLSSVMKIESKREMIARGVDSPDEADALGLYLYAKRLVGKRRPQSLTQERRKVPYMAV